MFNSDPVTLVARKAHTCSWCCEKILPGEKYERWVSIDDSAYTNKMHPECVEAASAGESGSWEYCPGDGQGMRPAPGVFGRALTLTVSSKHE